MTDSFLLNLPAPPCARLLGWRLLGSDPDKGWIRVGFEGKPDFLNPAGFIQGGILTAMLDDTMGPAVWLASGAQYFTVTIDLGVSFLKPARPGPLVAEATVLQMGGTIAFLEGKLLNEAGELLARANASARLVPAERALAA